MNFWNHCGFAKNIALIFCAYCTFYSYNTFKTIWIQEPKYYWIRTTIHEDVSINMAENSIFSSKLPITVILSGDFWLQQWSYRPLLVFICFWSGFLLNYNSTFSISHINSTCLSLHGFDTNTLENFQ